MTDPQEAVTHLNKLTTQSIDAALANSRNLYDIVSAAQSELTKLAEENLGSFNKSLIGAIESAAKNAPAGSDAALNAVKSSVAAAACGQHLQQGGSKWLNSPTAASRPPPAPPPTR